MTKDASPGGSSQLPKARYVERVEIVETFVDSMERMFLDGNTLRMEFTVRRWDDPKTGQTTPPTSKAYTAARIVMPLAGALEMFNKLNQLQTMLEQSGKLHRAEPVAPTQIN